MEHAIIKVIRNEIPKRCGAEIGILVTSVDCEEVTFDRGQHVSQCSNVGITWVRN